MYLLPFTAFQSGEGVGHFTLFDNDDKVELKLFEKGDTQSAYEGTLFAI